MTLELYQIAQHKKSTHSGKGRTYYEVAGNCGKQRYLIDTLGDPVDNSEKDWAIRGTYYHALHEWWQNGGVPEGSTIDISDELYWNEAVTLFNWYRQTFAKDAWGTSTGAETLFPILPEDKERVAAWFGVPVEYCPTVRTDLLTRATSEQVNRAFSEYGVSLPGAGSYLVDYKHGAKHNYDDATKFTQGAQPVLYMTMLKQFVDPELRGAVFTKVTMTREKGALTLKDTSFRTYVAHWQPSYAERSRAMIKNAYENLKAQQTNGFQCQDCAFYMSQCAGY